MKVARNVFFTSTVFMGILFIMLGTFNSIVVDKNAFLKNDYNITFAKRLDDMTGEVRVGRRAASISPWSVQNTNEKFNNKILKKSISKTSKISTSLKESSNTMKEIVKKEDKPAIMTTGLLELTGGLFNKKPLLKGQDYYGRASVVDGIIEKLDVTMPGGENFTVNFNKKMAGNVFQYEDSETREMRSGLMYELKSKGKFMVTLTDDTNFAGMRLEFSPVTEVTEEKLAASGKAHWGMNKHHVEDNPELDVNNYADDSYETDRVESYIDDYAESENFEFEEYQESEEELEGEQTAQNEMTIEQEHGKYAFNFQG